MVKGWDCRARSWYRERYDCRRNMVDWDYHMALMQAGTPGQDPALGSIIHFHHFRHWRMHGVAYELRDAQYNAPNRSMLSQAVGRTREFKDR
ncbi:dynein assembly factor 3, C-terminal domain-containing protein [Haematococcus lacustris]